MPLLVPALGFALGLFAAAAVGLPPLAIVALLAALAGLWALGHSAGLRLGVTALFLAAFLLGILRAGPGLPAAPDALASAYGSGVTLTGVVQGLPESVGASVRFQLDAGSTAQDRGAAAQPASGMVLVWANTLVPLQGRRFPYLLDGDVVTVRGTLGPPERIDSFDYPEQLAAQGIVAVLSGAQVQQVLPAGGNSPAGILHALRRELAGALAVHLPEPQASLTQALLLGMRGGLPAQVSDAFRRAGLAHILAVSGMHVGLVMGLSLLASAAIFGRHRRSYLLLPLSLLWAYVLLAGAPSSAVRAGAMGSVYLLALATGRAAVPLNALGLAALVMLAWDPRVLWDRGFQLSFASMAGVLAVGLPLWRAWSRLPWWEKTGMRGKGLQSGAWATALSALARWTMAGVLVSVGATLGSLPLVAFNFGQVPLLSIPATLLALPLLPPFLVSGAVAAFVGAFASPLGPLVAWAPSLIGGLLAWDARLFASIPGAAVDTTAVSAADVWLFYVLAAAVFAFVYRRHWLPAARSTMAALWRAPARPAHAALLLAGMALVAAAPSAASVGRPDGYLHVEFLDVGQGDAALVRTPGGATVLIDGGPDPRATMSLVDPLLPPMRKTVDLAVLTSPNADRLAGLLEMARRGHVQRVLVPPPAQGRDASWLESLRETGAQVQVVTAGTVVDIADGIHLAVLSPPLASGTASAVNDDGLALRLTYEDSAVLFTGGMSTSGERAMIARGGDLSAQVLELGNHGAANSTSPELLDAVRPAIAVVSAGPDNPFGDPSPDVIARALGYVPRANLFQTPLQGTVHLATDGSRWWAKTEH